MKILDGRPYIPQIRKLIEEYTSWLGRDLTFQNLEEELRIRPQNILRLMEKCWWQRKPAGLSG